MAKVYKGTERVDKFFKHYGVKGMKWKNHVYAKDDYAHNPVNAAGAREAQSMTLRQNILNSIKNHPAIPGASTSVLKRTGGGSLKTMIGNATTKMHNTQQVERATKNIPGGAASSIAREEQKSNVKKHENNNTVAKALGSLGLGSTGAAGIVLGGKKVMDAAEAKAKKAAAEAAKRAAGIEAKAKQAAAEAEAKAKQEAAEQLKKEREEAKKRLIADRQLRSEELANDFKNSTYPKSIEELKKTDVYQNLDSQYQEYIVESYEDVLNHINGKSTPLDEAESSYSYIKKVFKRPEAYAKRIEENHGNVSGYRSGKAATRSANAAGKRGKRN